MEYVSMWALAITSQQYDRFNKSYTVRKDDYKYYAFNEGGDIILFVGIWRLTIH